MSVRTAPAANEGQPAFPRRSNVSVWLELMRNLATRDVEIRYKHSLLGLYWAIINPLLTAAIYDLVFGVILGSNTGPIPYAVFLLTGLTIWNLFGNGVGSATVSVTGSAALLAKVYFPRIILPTAAVLARLIDFMFSVVILVVFVAAYRVPVYWTSILAVPVLGLEILFALGIGYIAAALNAIYRDMNQLIGLLLMVWMWLSPVMYATNTHGPILQSILLINPLGAMIQVQRDLIFQGWTSNGPYLWVAAIWSVFVFVAGLALFRKIEPLFAEVM